MSDKPLDEWAPYRLAAESYYADLRAGAQPSTDLWQEHVRAAYLKIGQQLACMPSDFIPKQAPTGPVVRLLRR